MSEVITVQRVALHSGRESMFSAEQQEAIGHMFVKLGTAQKVMDALQAEPGSEEAKGRPKKLFPKAVHVSSGTLYKIAKSQGVQLSRGGGKRQELDPKMEKLAIKALNDGGNAKQAEELLLKDGVEIPYKTLIELAKKNGIKLRRGNGSKYSDVERDEMVRLFKTNGSYSHTQRILNAANDDELAAYRDANIFPEPLNISVPTLSKYITSAGIRVVRRGSTIEIHQEDAA